MSGRMIREQSRKGVNCGVKLLEYKGTGHEHLSACCVKGVYENILTFAEYELPQDMSDCTATKKYRVPVDVAQRLL